MIPIFSAIQVIAVLVGGFLLGFIFGVCVEGKENDDRDWPR